MPAPLIPWAPNANYATGTGFAWQGTATKVTPAYVEFQPSPTFAPAAQEFNAMFAARDAYMNALAEEASPPTFLPSYALLGGIVAPTAAAFDPVALKFMTAGLNSSASRLVFMAGRGDPLNWLQMGGGVSPYTGGTVKSLCRGIEPSVSSKYMYSAIIGGVTGPGDISVLRIDTVGNAFSGSVPIGVTTDVTDAQVISVSGVVVAAVGSTNPAHTALVHSTDHGVTWTSVSLGGVTVQKWLLVQSVPGAGTIMLFGAFAGVDGYLTSTDGISWTAQSAPTLTGTETPTTLCYGVDGSGVACWVLSTFDSSSNLTNTYRSYNGTSWASFTNSLAAGVVLAKMSAVGQQLVGVVFESSPSRVVYSVDGGSTWLTTNLEAVYVDGLALAASANQFFLATDVHLSLGACVGSPGGFGAQ